MFTGIIEATAKVLETGANKLVLERPAHFDDIKIGSSIAVSGVCLSIISFDERQMSFDVIETTLKKTKLGSLAVGDYANLERAMRADGRFEGHIVTGHSEGVGVVVAKKDTILTITIPSPLLPFIVLHGSITIDGVALTVAEISNAQLSVALIPHTLEHTTLGSLVPGSCVNLETDILGRYILHSPHAQ